MGSCELSPEALTDAELAHVRCLNHGYMNCGKGSARTMKVAGVMDHQVSLLRAMDAPRPDRHEYDRHVAAVLVADPDNPADPNAVRVLIDGYMVGWLPRREASVSAPLVRDLARTGQCLVGSALLVGGTGDHYIGVRLQVRPQASTRWAKGRRPASIA